MDNQFRKKTGEDSYAAKHHIRQKEDEGVIDLYDDFKDPNSGKLDPEVEELKLMAQSDALRFYGWIRKSASKLWARISDLFRTINPKLAGVAVAFILVTFAGFKIIPALWGHFRGDKSEILGSSSDNTPSFPVLGSESPAGPTVYDDEIGVSITKDQIGGVPITISQQSLPEDIKQGVSTVEKLALSLSDKVAIDQQSTSKGQIFVVRTSTDSNTVIFSHSDSLVFIRSPSIIDSSDWIKYIDALR